MQKLKLDVEKLAVESFVPEPDGEILRGTVRGNTGMPSCAGYSDCGTCADTCQYTCMDCNTEDVTCANTDCTTGPEPTRMSCPGLATCAPAKTCYATE